MARTFWLSFSNRVASRRMSFMHCPAGDCLQSSRGGRRTAQPHCAWRRGSGHADRDFGVGFRRDYRQCAFNGDLLANGFTAVGFVGGNARGAFRPGSKRAGTAWLSCTCLLVITPCISRHFFTTAWTLLLRPRRPLPISCAFDGLTRPHRGPRSHLPSPFCAGCALMMEA